MTNPPHSAAPRASKIPMLARIFILSVLLPGSEAFADKGPHPLQEADVIALAKSHDPLVVIAKQEVQVAKATRDQASLRDNPSLRWDREHMPGTASEDALVFTLPIDLSSRIEVQRGIAGASIDRLRAQALQGQSAAAARALRIFYQIVAASRVHQIQVSAHQDLLKVLGVISKQKEAGKVSGYQEIRIEIEVEIAASEMRQTRATLSQMSKQLALLLGVAESSTFVGSLALHTRQDAAEPASWLLLASAAQKAKRASQSADQSFRPIVELSLGPKLALADETELGYVAGISVELPFRSKRSARKAMAVAEHRLATAQINAAKVAVERKKHNAMEKLASAAVETKRFLESTAVLLSRLERASSSRYREGQSIMELLDAQRTRTLVQTRHLQLQLGAKEAEIELRVAQGEFE